MNTMEIFPCDVSEMENLFFKNGLLYPVPFATVRRFSRNEQLYFMWKHGIYVLPTTELCSFLKEHIKGSAIEIGAGTAGIARGLNIPATDSMMQKGMVSIMYQMMGQPTIVYPDDVEHLEASEAIKKYRPDTVIGAYITQKWEPDLPEGNLFGPDENFIINNTQVYINIGNLATHGRKKILKTYKYKAYNPEVLITRGDKDMNRVFIFHNPSLLAQ